MKEILDIVSAFGNVCARNETAVLASVVEVEGSTYRRPGARALIVADNEFVGLIGGGCLESDLLDQARRVRQHGQASVVRYDSTAKDEIVWGLGLGCAGKVDVLLEPVSKSSPGPLDFLAGCIAARRTAVVATVIDSHAEGLIGARWMRDANHWVVQSSNWVGSWVGDEGVDEVITSAKPRHVVTGGERILIESFQLPVHLVIVGAGVDAAPLVRLAGELGWVVDVLDHRKALAVAERFPAARTVASHPVRNIAAEAAVDERSAVVLMTHHYLNDQELLGQFLASDAGYLGVLGPKKRLTMLLEDLGSADVEPTREQRKRLHGPVGLDIGAESPEEIALSIVSEIQAHFSRSGGGSLSQKAGPIHEF